MIFAYRPTNKLRNKPNKMHLQEAAEKGDLEASVTARHTNASVLTLARTHTYTHTR